MSDYRFALRNYAGDITRTYFVDAASITEDRIEVDPSPSHLIFVVDCSGSMYYTLEDIKSMLEKLLAVEEFQNAGMLISLLSYASSGDVLSHFERVPVEDVMSPGSPHVTSIRALRTRGLTCISQSLAAAKSLVREGETTCISLHSDGYANDRSPRSEQTEISRLVTELAAMPGVFVNTIAYSNWSDFQMLSWIANSVSGTCTKASNVKQVHEALHDTGRLLAGDMAPAFTSEIGDADLQIFVSANARKTVGSTEDLKIRGLSVDDDKTIYRFTEVPLSMYQASTLAEIGSDGVSTIPALAFARANLAMGNVNAAKYAVVTSRALDLLTDHYRALTGPQLAEFSTSIESYLFADQTSWELCAQYGLDLSRPSLLSVADVLANNTRHFRVDAPELREHYTRRGLKRVAGVRDEDGCLVPPKTRSVSRGNTDLQHVSGFDINRSNATINMRLTYPIQLQDVESGDIVDEVAGIPLDLSAFNNYTLVGDGEILVSAVPIRISSQALFMKLRELDANLLTNKEGDVVDKFNPQETVWIELEALPLVDFKGSYEMPGNFDRIVALTAAQKFLSALTKGTSVEYSAEQIEALKERHVTPALYFSPPTTTAYTSLTEALEKGLVDSRLSYEVRYGVPNLTSLSSLHSGNKCLERFYVLKDAQGGEISKPKVPDILGKGVTVEHKTLSSRVKITAVDDVMRPVFDALLGVDPDFDSSEIVSYLTSAGVNVSELLDVTARRTVDGDSAIARAKEALRKVESYLDQVYRLTISPLVFFIGATGLVPDELQAKAMTADEFVAAFPDAKLSKDEKEATFFVVGDEVLTVFVTNVHFTTPAGIEAYGTSDD